MAYQHQRLLNAVSACLSHPAFAASPTVGRIKTPPPLVLPVVQIDLEQALDDLGCSAQLRRAVEETYRIARERLVEECQRNYSTAAKSLSVQFADYDHEEYGRWVEGLAHSVQQRYTTALLDCGSKVLEEVRLAKSRYSSTSTSSTPSILSTFSHPLLPQQAPTEAAGSFTEEVVGILQRAFKTKDTLTRAEVKSLAAVTHLNTKQIRTWFANQRQRRGGRKGAAPYNLAITRPPTQRNITPRRNVSNSSSDSSLISYADSNVSLTPPKHDVFFPSPSIELPVPLPPQHRRMQEPSSFPSYAPSHANEEIDVPMMNYTEPTPTHSQFARPPPPRLPLESTHFPLPSPPTTAQTDSFFSLPLPSDHTPPLSYSPTDSSPFPSPPQHQNSPQLSFLDQLQSTDPFLDDQFLQNVFGNLGVTANGGLTLMMDTIEDSEGQGGKGFSCGW